MKSKLIIVLAISVVAYPSILPEGNAATRIAGGTAGYGQTSGVYSSDQLDNLLAPIALYPDPLLAQMLPAATFLDQVQQAAQWLRSNNNVAAIDTQPWDVSVKSIAHYPDILYKMADQADWTAALGQAYITQSSDVSASIQRLRNQARSAGTLVSTPQQMVGMDNGAVTIVPAQPNYIYVPSYDPYEAYYPSTGAYVASSLISFGAGFAIGAWLNRGWNWWGGGPYYHGWVGGGWIGASRPWVNWRNGNYVNHRFNNINVNNNIFNRNINAGNLNRFNSIHRGTNWGNVGGRHGRPSTLPARPGTPGGGLGGRPGAPGGRPGMPGAGTRPGTLPARPGTPGGRPGMPGAGARPGTLPARPGTPGARPGMGTPGARPGTPGARPGMPSTRPASPGARPGTFPGAGNRMSTSRPGGFNPSAGRMPRASQPMNRSSFGGARNYGGRSYGGGRNYGGGRSYGGHRGGGGRSFGGGGHRGGGGRSFGGGGRRGGGGGRGGGGRRR